MDFFKGAMIGIIAGTIAGTTIGVMNENNILQMVKQGKKGIKKMKKKYTF